MIAWILRWERKLRSWLLTWNGTYVLYDLEEGYFDFIWFKIKHQNWKISFTLDLLDLQKRWGLFWFNFDYNSGVIAKFLSWYYRISFLDALLMLLRFYKETFFWTLYLVVILIVLYILYRIACYFGWMRRIEWHFDPYN